jgi:hypothetical protein
MDPFAKLPVEIIWQILESCDFAGLDGLQQISPRVEQAFNSWFKKITESVLINCSHACQGLHGYFTLLASIQSTPFTPETLLAELTSLSENAEQVLSRNTGRGISLSTHSLAAVRHTIGTAAKIQFLACACFQCLLTRLESAKPRLPGGSHAELDKWIQKKGPAPQGGEFFQFEIDPPSWIESYRMHRSLWRLELFHQIHDAAINRWLWSTNEMNYFIEEYLEWLHYPEELETVSECIVDLCSSKPPILNPQAPFFIAVPPPNLTLPTWPLPMVEDTPDSWSRCPNSALYTNPVRSYFKMLRSGEKGRGWHTLWQLDFRMFRRLGLPLWDKWRLYQMGLIPQSRQVLSPQGTLVGGQAETRSRWIDAYIWFSFANIEQNESA